MHPYETPLLGRDRQLRERTLGLCAALLLQTGIFLLLTQSVLHPVPPARTAMRELMLMLPQFSRPNPTQRKSAEPRRQTASPPPIFAPPPIFTPPSLALPVPSPNAIQDFGRALFGCRPDNYNELPADQRAHCPPPGGSARPNGDRVILNPKPQAKDEAFWQEQWREDHYLPPLCEGDTPPCQIATAAEENRRAMAARDAIAAQETARVNARPPPADEKLLAPRP